MDKEKKVVYIEGCMQREVGQPAVVRLNGQWLQTSPVVRTEAFMSHVFIETRNSIYKTR